MQCKAHNRQGKQCGNPPMKGGTVCRMHGGAAPQVKAASARRLLEELIEPALIQMKRIIEDDTVADQVKMTAIRDILDRTGYKPVSTVEVVTRDAMEREYERLVAEYDSQP